VSMFIDERRVTTWHRLFERGIGAIGQDYLCHTLWDKYLQFENEGHDFHRMALIYERILSVPCKELEQYHGK